jgi:hypothetical protein
MFTGVFPVLKWSVRQRGQGAALSALGSKTTQRNPELNMGIHNILERDLYFPSINACPSRVQELR